MDDGEIEPSDPAFLQNSSTFNSINNNNPLPEVSVSADSMLDELLKHSRRTCTHTHTCNPPGPDAAHTHTCYHTHTHVFSSEEDTKNRCETSSSLKPRKPLGNREAVRKYREKKKAHTAFLEEEVKKLRLLNQHLLRKLQRQTVLEAEILRMRALLVDLRGKIDVELGSFGFSGNTGCSKFIEDDYGIQSTKNKSIRLQCQTQLPCFFPQGNQSLNTGNGQGGNNKAIFSWQDSCQPVILDCQVSGNGVIDAPDCPLEDVETLISAKNHGH